MVTDKNLPVSKDINWEQLEEAVKTSYVGVRVYDDVDVDAFPFANMEVVQHPMSDPAMLKIDYLILFVTYL